MPKNSSILSLFSILLGGYYFFYFAIVGVYVIFLPKTLTDLGYSAFDIGAIFAAAPFMRFLLPFLFRDFVPLTPNIYLLSLLFTFIGALLFLGTATDFWFFLFANVLFGAAMGISLPYVETIALSTLSKEYYGKVRLWGSLGFIIIALWLGKVLTLPYESLYYLSGLAFFTLIFGALLIQYDKVEHDAIHKDSAFSLSKYWAFWLSIFLMQLGFGGFYNFFTIYALSYGVSLEMTSWMWSFGVICEIIMLYYQGPLLQRNLLNILQFATLATALRWLLLYLYPESLTMTFISQSFHAISFALYHTAAITYVFSLYSQKKLAQQFFLGIAFGLGGSLGALLSGQIYGEYLFLVEAGITLLAFIALLIHQKRRNTIL
ncbi:MAG: Probable 3-phenylpropionic acid transporter [uncultured Sulfurovum sp.]|uniref:Probable 3-phenylpropionic acid transporter n=1 Tax=uncultured Sulfurovum sp. TaxID=269237 RepID=A0A6S6UCD4_9BACT|nr:MAG: Probable 3-phenylpropionic acid transporter [uncultured Sulfurovum sp.]